MEKNLQVQHIVRAARLHLEQAIEMLDSLDLHQAAANADLALATLNRSCPEGLLAALPDWPTPQ